MKWTVVLVSVTVMGVVGCSDVPKEPEATPKVTTTEPKEPPPYKEPANTAFLEARKGVIEELNKRGDASVVKLPETSGYATVNADPKNVGYYEVLFKGKRTDMDVELDFEVILHQDKVTREWIVDLTNVGKGKIKR